VAPRRCGSPRPASSRTSEPDIGGDSANPAVRIRRENADGTGLTLASSAIALSADTLYRMRMIVDASGSGNVKIKVWPLTQDEPAGWTLTATESTLTAVGRVGLFFGCTVSALTPHTAYVDNYTAHVRPTPPLPLRAVAVSPTRVDLTWADGDQAN
jgi:hypothetical protein